MSDTEMMLREALEAALKDPSIAVGFQWTATRGGLDQALQVLTLAALASSPGGERDAVIEECAKVADGFIQEPVFGAYHNGTCRSIASAIRALKSQPSDLGEGR